MAVRDVPRLAEPSQLELELMKARLKAEIFGESSAGRRVGHFELIRKLGQGASGVVYHARDTRNGLELALKLLHTRDARAVQRFKQEFRGLTHLVHENLVQLHELYAQGDEWYFTMELVRGVSFTRYFAAHDSSDPLASAARVRAALRQLLAAVHAIHAAGKLHRDLKPSNVLITPAGRVVVLDFGLLTTQCAAEQRRPRATALGTPPYIAPEVEAGENATAASDAYAIGVILFQVLTARQPFAADSRGFAHTAQAPVAPRAREFASAIPEDLDELAAGLLERDPQRRTAIEGALGILQPFAAPATAQPLGAAPWVGRGQELSQLHAAFAALREVRPVVVFLGGRSGIGKSALLARFAEQLQGRATILRARCHERESMPYKAFDGLIDSLPPHLLRLPRDLLEALSASETGALLQVFPSLKAVPALAAAHPVQNPAGPQELRQLAFMGLKKLLRGLSQHAPLVLLVDDLQWADLDSARLLLEVLGPPEAPTLLYVGSYRDAEAQHGEFLREVLAPDVARETAYTQKQLTLGPLGERETLAMARGLLRGTPAAELVCERVAREAVGIPLFVSELVTYFRQELQGDSTGVSLSDLMERRLLALGVIERRALALLSLAARPLSEELLGHALGVQAPFQRALRRLSLQGLVHADAHGRLVIYHDQLREQVSARMPNTEASALHRQLAEAYDRVETGEPEWLIEHWRAAGDLARARSYAIAAAELAVGKLAFNRGAALYRTALELGVAEDADTSALYGALGDVLANAGRGTEAARAYLSAAQSAAGATEAFSLRCRATQQFLRGGLTAEATVLLRTLLQETGLRYPDSTPEIALQWLLSRGRLLLRRKAWRLGRRRSDARSRARLLVLGSVFRECAVTDPVRGALFQSLFYEEALRAGDPEHVFIGFAWDTYNYALLASAQRYRRVEVRLTELARLAADLATPYAQATASFVRGAALISAARYAEAAVYTRRALPIFREHCVGAAWEEALCALTDSMVLENVGPLETLCRETPPMVRRADERVDQLSDALLCASMGPVLLIQDKPHEALEFLSKRLERLSSEFDVQWFTVTARMIDALLYAGEGVRALRTIEGFWRRYLRSGYDRFEFTSMLVRMRRARCALAAFPELGDPALHRIVTLEAARLQRMRKPDTKAQALGMLAALCFQQGNLDRAAQHLKQSLPLIESMGVGVPLHCYYLRLARVTPAAEAEAWRARGAGFLRAQGVVDPERFCRVYAPGFESRKSSVGARQS
jgi:tetratricopeptide (TPR) repeat protein